MPTISNKPKVLIVGGSFSGLTIARFLSHETLVTIVEPKNYFEYTPGILHCLTGSNGYTKISAETKDIKHGFSVLHGYLVGLQPLAHLAYIFDVSSAKDEVTAIPYDAIVFCTGSPYIAPIRPSLSTTQSYIERQLEIKEFANQLVAANSVLLAGGGLVGVELAAELAVRQRFNSDGSRKQITLLTRSTVLDTLPTKAGKIAHKWLEQNGVIVITNDEIDSSSTMSTESKLTTYRTKAGLNVTAEMFLDCTGRMTDGSTPEREQRQQIRQKQLEATLSAQSKPFSSYRGSSSDESLQPNSLLSFPSTSASAALLTVDEFFSSAQLPREAGVFAIGDGISRIRPLTMASSNTRDLGAYGIPHQPPTIRNAHLAEHEAETCAHNVMQFLRARSIGQAPLLKRYPESVFHSDVAPVNVCVSLGMYRYNACFLFM